MLCRKKGSTILILGLTGGIGTGKTTVAKILESYGARIIYADNVGHRVLEEGEVLGALVKNFGTEILGEDGTIDRKKLGQLVFSSPSSLQILNSITHPIIKARISEILDRWRDEGEVAVAVVEAALLIETGMTESVDKVAVVVADRKVQISRILERNGLMLNEANERVEAQIPSHERLLFADYIIENNSSSIEELEAEVWRLWLDLMTLCRGAQVNGGEGT